MIFSSVLSFWSVISGDDHVINSVVFLTKDMEGYIQQVDHVATSDQAEPIGFDVTSWKNA